jgi:hypothetical protein
MGGQVDRNKDDKAKQGKKNRSRGKDDKAKQGKKNRSRGKDDKAKRGKKQAEHDKAKQAADKAKQGKKKHDKAKQAADKAKQAADDDDWRILLADYKAKQAKRTTRPRGPRAAGKPKLESQIKKIRSRGAAVVEELATDIEELATCRSCGDINNLVLTRVFPNLCVMCLWCRICGVVQ